MRAIVKGEENRDYYAFTVFINRSLLSVRFRALCNTINDDFHKGVHCFKGISQYSNGKRESCVYDGDVKRGYTYRAACLDLLPKNEGLANISMKVNRQIASNCASYLRAEVETFFGISTTVLHDHLGSQFPSIRHIEIQIVKFDEISAELEDLRFDNSVRHTSRCKTTFRVWDVFV